VICLDFDDQLLAVVRMLRMPAALNHMTPECGGVTRPLQMLLSIFELSGHVPPRTKRDFAIYGSSLRSGTPTAPKPVAYGNQKVGQQD
jgi:hypothetical protein